MPRLGNRRQLPPLSEFCPRLRTLPLQEKTTAGIVDCLRGALPCLRQTGESPFYAVREVARAAGVSFKTAQRAYKQLAAEGLLRVVRGSQTLVMGRRQQPRRPLRGVVAVPIWMPGFMAFADWRWFFRHLENRVRRQNFVADLIFTERTENKQPEFVEQILDHHADYVIWPEPLDVHLACIDSLADAGVRVVTIANPLVFPRATYALRWERALQTGLRCWKEEGIRAVVVPRHAGAFTSATNVLEPVLQRVGLSYSFPIAGPTESVANYLNRLARDPRVGIVFDEDDWYCWLWREDCRAMIRLLQRARVMIMRPPDVRPLRRMGVTVDALLMPWNRVAERVARDLGTAVTGRVVFEAAWHPRLSADELLARCHEPVTKYR